jgi:hypothetical protein
VEEELVGMSGESQVNDECVPSTTDIDDRVLFPSYWHCCHIKHNIAWEGIVGFHNAKG